MSPVSIAITVIALVVVAALGFIVWTQQRRHRLRARFGPEYDRALQESESRREAERELLAREQRYHELHITPLRAGARENYRKEWMNLQDRFVDDPAGAVVEADRLVAAVMGERGYPTEDFEQQLAVLSVEHARTLDHYRRAHDISARAGQQAAATEDLRQAMLHYRALFDELLDHTLQTGGGDADADRPGIEPTEAASEARESAGADEAPADQAASDNSTVSRDDRQKG